jgi:putative ABC transport system permease protein
MGDWTQDLRLAVRSLSRAPGFTAVTVGTLGLAIGANAGVFSVIDAVLLDPLPYADADRIVYIGATAPGSEIAGEFPPAPEFYLQYQGVPGVESLAAFNSFTSTLRVDDRVERVRMSVPTSSLFEALGVEPLLGRLPLPDEDAVAVLSHALWMTWFAGDPAVIGRTVYASGANREIVGVMGPGFWFPSEDTALWIPAPILPESIVPGRFGMTGLVARLAPDMTMDALAADLDVRASRLPERFGGSAGYARIIERHRAIVRPLHDQLYGSTADLLWILLASVGIVLLIACANVANLFMVRSETRMRDFAVRRALGAGRGRLMGVSMAEAAVVAALAGTLAVAIASVGVPALLTVAPQNVPRMGQAQLGPATLGFTALASVLCALACGLAPAVRSSGSGLGRLREGGRGATGRGHWGRDALVIAQSALALVVLIGSGLLGRSFQALRDVDPGYDVEDVYTFQIGTEDEQGLTDGPSFALFQSQFMDRIAALPGVTSVGIIENVPLNEGVANGRYRTQEHADDPDAGVLLSYTWAGGDYWGTMGIEVLEGRALRTDDHAVGVNNVVIGRRAADLLWPGESALGRVLISEASRAGYTVVGVVEDILQDEFRDTPDPLLYLPLVGPTPTSWALSSPAYVVKTARAEVIGPEIREIARELAPTAPMYRTFTMAGLASDSMVQLSFTALALGIASGLALILGTIGLYGVLSHVVAQRTREIGVRMALGAEASSVRRMVVRQGARVVVAGVVIGAAVALGATRALEGILYGVEPADITTFLAMSAGMLLVGLLASYLPARRASSVDPVESLK